MTLSPTAAAAFDAVEAGGVSETNRPPAGHVGELTVTEAKTSNKDGNEYALIEFVDGSYKWSQFAWITGPKRSEGGIKAFKFTVRQLTGQEPTGATLAALLGRPPASGLATSRSPRRRSTRPRASRTRTRSCWAQRRPSRQFRPRPPRRPPRSAARSSAMTCRGTSLPPRPRRSRRSRGADRGHRMQVPRVAASASDRRDAEAGGRRTGEDPAGGSLLPDGRDSASEGTA